MGVMDAAARRRAPPRVAAAAVCILAALASRPATAADLTPPFPLVFAAPTAPVIPGVAAFRWSGDAATRAAVERCMAAAIYYEAGGETLAGRRAVAQVVLNRVRHPAYPNSVCGVVYQGAPHRGCQFTFACDGSLNRVPDAAGWRDAEVVATQALDGFVAAEVGAATHYHTMAVHPAWDSTLTPVTRIGAHRFFRFPGAGPATLSRAYAGVETTVPLGGGTTAVVAAARGRRGAEPLPAPREATFSVWGLQVARVSPAGSAPVAADVGAVAPAL